MMTTYSIVRAHGRTFLFAKCGDYSSHIEVDTIRLSPESVLKIMEENEVAPEHLQNVYDDLLFEENMV